MKIDKELYSLVKKVVEIRDQKYDIVKNEVNYILKNKVKEDMRIQRTLDILFEFCEENEGLLLYKKLCKYYYDINQIVTIDYIRYYKEEYEDGS
ncbi:MAG: hypothetical protein FWC79_06115 [Oscillospiraceae bacterium]|nr:hypothetical protein [Oscillospiraceae bacterium]